MQFYAYETRTIDVLEGNSVLSIQSIDPAYDAYYDYSIINNNGVDELEVGYGGSPQGQETVDVTVEGSGVEPKRTQ